MSTGGWDKRQWELLNGVVTGDGDGPYYLKTLAASSLLGVLQHDYVRYTYVGTNVSEVNFYVGGSGGTIVSTIQFSYDSLGNITDVTRT